MSSILISFEKNICLIQHSFFEKKLSFDFNDTKALQTLFSTLATIIKNSEINIALPFEKTIMRELTLDITLSETDILTYLNTESQTLFGRVSEQLAMDYQTEKKNAEKIQVITAYATHAEIVQLLKDTCKKYHLCIKTIGITGINHRINFLPWREVAKQKKSYRQILIALCISFLCFIFLICTKLFLIEKIKTLTQENQKLTHEVSVIHTTSAKKNIAILQKIKLLSKQKDVSERENTLLITTLENIANTLPNGVALTMITIDSAKIIISGDSTVVNTIHQYQLNLQAAFQNNVIKITKITASNTTPNTVHFEMDITK